MNSFDPHFEAQWVMQQSNWLMDCLLSLCLNRTSEIQVWQDLESIKFVLMRLYRSLQRSHSPSSPYGARIFQGCYRGRGRKRRECWGVDDHGRSCVATYHNFGVFSVRLQRQIWHFFFSFLFFILIYRKDLFYVLL